MKPFLPGALFLAALCLRASAGFDTIIDEPLDAIRIYAQDGDPSAQFHLAVLYMNGEGVRKDPAQAAVWLRKAAAAGHPDAEYGLATVLATGNGLSRDDKEAGKWFHAAARQGFFDAQRVLILGYARGVGGEQSMPKALKWDFLARRTLELRYQANPGLPPKPSILRPDGSAEFIAADGKHQLIDASGHIRDLDSNAPVTASPFSGLVTDGPLVPIAPEPSKLFRQQAIIDRQLASLAGAERETRYFLGATEADYNAARGEAHDFILELGATPQRKDAAAKSGQPAASETAPPPPEPLHPLKTDRSEAYPLGMWGREAIKVQPWKHAETAHFVVHYTDKSSANAAMRYIECAYFVATETLQIDTHASARKMHVFIFPDVASWETFKSKQMLPARVAGLAYKDELLLVALEEQDTYIKVLCHEATHAVVSHFYPGRKLPLWLNEGFAEYTAARSIALRRGQKTARYMNQNAPGDIQVGEVFDRIHYGTPSAPSVGADGAPVDPNHPLFYAQAEKCASVLLEKLPASSFPRFANLAFAGNPMPVCFRTAYGKQCPSSEAFQALLNAPR